MASDRKQPSRVPVTRAMAIVARVAVAVLGGYLLAVSFATAMVNGLTLPRAEAVDLAISLSFLPYAGAVLWAFAARTPAIAAVGILVPVALLVLVQVGASALAAGGAV
ncbi:hypothetical protein [Aquisalimonas asiatica]|uniref:Iron transporter n=1 Tax=Aquisalimonas asiatica TaxID=406100 RepID=A0A1H8TCY9_9GAMM|nr:hypothetical protein [Aquisalimonas asiatica]SEO89009.1 hypothetical protein SAMN04488052_10487 [Aquisalimonas asiatica]